MGKIDSMKDIDGNQIKKDDFVEMVEGKPSYVNGAMKKGFIFKIYYIENRPLRGGEDYHVAFVGSKGTSGRVYNSGCTSKEIRKVEYKKS